MLRRQLIERTEETTGGTYPPSRRDKGGEERIENDQQNHDKV